ncbi:TPA: iron ABC transporter permease [Escherichia coli]|uniref:FecCD family ABC transporter permease n=1 Tax=Proteus hauseri TaxID=183417 RepID=UPI000EE68124|nr:iron ABC transporter permease [Proteus hauseri]QAV23114.1 Fe(3+)-siderophore ABC transporter permease [Proteus hauseri]HCH51437.1 Fe(3+)-siderophore ABC transporter permease [Proteus sp. (in: enterobacteria)]HDH9217935.1 iron ABC transporter permease [Escherichia coli]
MSASQHVIKWGIRGAIFLLGAFALLSLFVGSRYVSIETTWNAFIAFDATNSEHLLVRYLRFPRTLLAIVIGIALGGAGTLMQALTRNPLADPGLFGINAGAMVAIVSLIALTGITDVTLYMWFGLLGAFLAGIGVYLLGGVRHGINPIRMVLSGVALSVVLLAMTQLITVNSDEKVFDQFRHWVVGSLQGRSFDVLYPITILVAIGSVIAYSLTRALDIVTLGDDVSHALGANQNRVWLLSAFAIVLLAGSATAAVGPISFLGLTAPHFARRLVGAEYRRILPMSMLIGATIMLIADCLGRLIGTPGEISVGIMISLIGGPFFIYLVKRWRIITL